MTAVQTNRESGPMTVLNQPMKPATPASDLVMLAYLSVYPPRPSAVGHGGERLQRSSIGAIFDYKGRVADWRNRTVWIRDIRRSDPQSAVKRILDRA